MRLGEIPLGIRLTAAGGVIATGLLGCSTPESSPSQPSISPSTSKSSNKEEIRKVDCTDPGGDTWQPNDTVILRIQASSREPMVFVNYGDTPPDKATSLVWRIPGKEWHDSNPEKDASRETVLYSERPVDISLQDGAWGIICTPYKFEEAKSRVTNVKSTRSGTEEVVLIQPDKEGKTYTEKKFTQAKPPYHLDKPNTQATYPS